MRSQRPLRPCSRTVSPVVALCGLFPGGAGAYPARTAEATPERVAGKRKRTVPVILNEVKNPFSLLHADRDGSGGTEAEVRILRLRCAPLRMTTTEGWRGTTTEHTRMTYLQTLRVFTRPRRGKQSRRLSTARRTTPGRSPDPLLLTKRREEMKCNSLTSQKNISQKGD